MARVYCQICRLPMMCVGGPEVEGQILDIHQRTEHPDVLPWACETCVYVPLVLEADRCTEIQDGVICPLWKARPAWLRG